MFTGDSFSSLWQPFYIRSFVSFLMPLNLPGLFFRRVSRTLICFTFLNIHFGQPQFFSALMTCELWHIVVLYSCPSLWRPASLSCNSVSHNTCLGGGVGWPKIQKLVSVNEHPVYLDMHTVQSHNDHRHVITNLMKLANVTSQLGTFLTILIVWYEQPIW